VFGLIDISFSWGRISIFPHFFSVSRRRNAYTGINHIIKKNTPGLEKFSVLSSLFPSSIERESKNTQTAAAAREKYTVTIHYSKKGEAYANKTKPHRREPKKRLQNILKPKNEKKSFLYFYFLIFYK